MAKPETDLQRRQPAGEKRAPGHRARHPHRRRSVRGREFPPARRSAAQRLRGEGGAGGARPCSRLLKRTSGGLQGIRIAVLPDELFQSLAGTETSQGVIALVEPPSWVIEQLFRGRSLVVVLDGVQDPGNAGTIVRAAEAFGATGVMFLKGTASPFNPKTLRASAGSLFRMPFVHSIDAELARAAFKQNKLDVYAGVPFSGKNHVKSLPDADLTRKCAVIIGNEGRGVSESLHAGAIDLAIPTVGVESLNAAMAAGSHSVRSAPAESPCKP